MTLLDKADVRALVPQELFSDDQLTVTMRLVAGWLREDTGLTDLPDPLPDTHALWAPALELVALVASNPTSLAVEDRWTDVAGRGRSRASGTPSAHACAPPPARTGGAGGAAAGCFPPAQPWPDAVRLPAVGGS
jgi:hypothetical protein